MSNFLFILSKDDNEAATRCFQFSKKHLEHLLDTA